MPIALEQLSFSYQPRRHCTEWALHEVSFTIQPGEFIALAGRSGSGKSTLVQILKGLLTPTRGRLMIDGVDPAAARRGGLFDQVGLVFQYPEHQLFSATVYDDVAFGPRQQAQGQRQVDEADLRRRVAWAMSAVGLDLPAWADRHPQELSGGEKRRVAIAGVLALKPRLLILDEPTAGLDARGRRSLFDLLHRLNREEGVTILLVGHRPEEILAHASRLLVLDSGGIVGDGTPQQLFGDATVTTACGLAQPDCLRLAGRLAAEGIPVPERPWDPPVAAAQILARLAARRARP
jgi:energy-coupling factor transport system ATP-binding protein